MDKYLLSDKLLFFFFQITSKHAELHKAYTDTQEKLKQVNRARNILIVSLTWGRGTEAFFVICKWCRQISDRS